MRQLQPTLFKSIAFAGLLAGSVLAPRLAPGQAHASNVPTVTVVGVARDTASVKVSFVPVPGAKDYRIYDVSAPRKVKYAGMRHISVYPWCPSPGCHFAMQADGVTPVFPYRQDAQAGPTTLDIPGNEIEWNGINDGQPHTLVVQALDALGPTPPGNLYTANNSAVSPTTMSMLGGNAGATPDGNLSINGQGPSTNAPHVIAQSAPFVVQANAAIRPLPSGPDAAQVALTTFANGDALTQTGENDAALTATYTLTPANGTPWDIQYQNADVRDSKPFVMDGHFMDVLFDGGTPGTNNPLHVSWGVMAMSPRRSFDMSSGRILHLTTEVDMHQGGRRWMEWFVAPANDPITTFHSSANRPLNHSGTYLDVQLTNNGCVVSASVYGSGHTIAAAAGQGDHFCTNFANDGGGGRGLDNRSRVDLFVSTNRYAVFEDGHLVSNEAISPALPLSTASITVAHYTYHTSLDHQELLQYSPWEHYWIDQFPYSDERHWQNMGAEVLPATAVQGSDWSSLAPRVQPAPPETPDFAQNSQTVTPIPATGMPTAMPPDMVMGTVTALPAVGSTPTALSTPSGPAPVGPPPAATDTSTPIVSTPTASMPSASPTPSTTAASSPTPTVMTSPATVAPIAPPPVAPITNGLSSGTYTVETRIIDAQGHVRVDTTAPLVIP